MCLIADLLPQHSLHLILYPTPQMQTSVARLYAHILNFLLSSLKWYNDSRTVHAFKSIFQPWDLKFKQDYEAIAAEAQQVGRLADVALKAEVRDTRLEVVQGTRHWELVRQEINQLKVENERLASLLQAKFGIMEDSIHCGLTHILFWKARTRPCHARSKPDYPASAILTDIANSDVQRDPLGLHLSARNLESNTPQSNALTATLELSPDLRRVPAILPVHAEQAP